ncbi:ABC transporter ATP-binding protein/permease [Tundrisphaera sp. TA3]|uniref:ABC transporter ATP-binding protein/permease n=1 Tax=Tundrisphaera sp. TA3 TaxID=3435775 RepID=UPI003EB696CA
MPKSKNGRALGRILMIVRPVFVSDVRWRVFAWLGLLVSLVFGVIILNVVNSYVNRGFMTAIQERKNDVYIRMGILYLLVFAASTVVAVFQKFSEERLAILWRGWLTAHLLNMYLNERGYHRLMERGDIDNPDQRISEDVKTFTTTTLSFLLMLTNATMTAIAFASVLWMITPVLLFVSVGYAIVGSLVTILVGRKLVGLNNLQLKKEADFRHDLIHVREYADSIALFRGEAKQKARLYDRLGELVENFREITSVNRNLGFFTVGYNYMIQIIPILIVAPMFIRGQVEFGVVTQSIGAFATILGAFSLIITQFPLISSFAAVVERLGTIWEVLDGEKRPPETSITMIDDDNRLAYEHLTLVTPKDGSVLVRDLTLDVPTGRRLLIQGPDGIGKSALARATAGIWPTGTGTIIRPGRDQIMFVPQRPYTALGTLRDQFYDVYHGKSISDERLIQVLCQVSFGPHLDRLGGLDVERDWANLLTVGEQQLLSIARLLVAAPKYAFLDRATNALSMPRVRHIYQILSESKITYISVGDQPGLREFHDDVLELLPDGQWTVGPTREPAAA